MRHFGESDDARDVERGATRRKWPLLVNEECSRWPEWWPAHRTACVPRAQGYSDRALYQCGPEVSEIERLAKSGLPCRARDGGAS